MFVIEPSIKPNTLGEKFFFFKYELDLFRRNFSDCGPFQKARSLEEIFLLNDCYFLCLNKKLSLVSILKIKIFFINVNAFKMLFSMGAVYKDSTVVKVKVSQSCPKSLQTYGLYSPWNSLGQNTGVGSLCLLQGVFPMQGSNPGLPHCRRILYYLSHLGSPRL